jgi:hypothetical protein
VAQAFDFATVKAGVPLEMYFNGKADRFYVTTAKPGHLHVFDIAGNPGKPKLLKSIPAAEGAHHVGITKDELFAFVQNPYSICRDERRFDHCHRSREGRGGR